MKAYMILCATILMATSAFCSDSSTITGSWKTDGGDSRLEIFTCGERVCGKIIWLKVPSYIDSQDGPVGKIKVDRKNPDPKLRGRPILGLQVINGLTSIDARRWANGICYNPETGKSYKCKMQLASPDRLELRGYIGCSLIGRTFGLTRQKTVAYNLE